MLKGQRSNQLLQRKIELEYRLSENRRIDMFEEQYEWMSHYHQELKQMYNIFQGKLRENYIRIEISFDEFKMFVYQNTECNFDSKKHKKTRLLI